MDRNWSNRINIYELLMRFSRSRVDFEIFEKSSKILSIGSILLANQWLVFLSLYFNEIQKNNNE